MNQKRPLSKVDMSNLDSEERKELMVLFELGLIEPDRGDNRDWRLTDKGREWHKYNKINF